MRPKDVALLLRTFILHKDPPTVFIWGPPGVGKSAVVRQAASYAGIGFIDLRLALMDPTDLRGIPVPKEGKAFWLPPSVLPTAGRGILFLDELTLAPQLVQSSAYQLVLDHRLGEYVLPDGWQIVAAGNGPEHGANVFKMASPLCNRFVHIEFDVNLDDWRKWAIENGIGTEIIEFTSFLPDRLFRFDPKAKVKAFASPRTWEFASIIWEMRDSLPRDVLIEVLGGTVSPSIAAEFIGYIDIRESLPSIEEIFSGKNYVPDRMDVACAVVTALAVRALPEQFGRLLEYAEHLEPEVGALLAKMLLGKNKDAVLRCLAWKKFAIRHADLLME